jgi:hypothetical protein
MNDAQVLLKDFTIGLELQTTHPHRGDSVTAAATNSAPALILGCASCFEGSEYAILFILCGARM